MEFNPFREVQTEALEHENMLLDLSHILSTPQGQNFIKYLLKHFGVGDLPAVNIPPNIRDEYLGFLRAGQSVFEIVSQADDIKAGLILAKIQKEKYDEFKKMDSNGQS